MSDLVEFLRARLDEDERNAERAGSGNITHYGGTGGHPTGLGVSAWGRGAGGSSYSPQKTRMLREVEAKRAILAEHSSDDSDWCHTCESGTGHCLTLAILASVYRDYRDYDPAWAPARDD